MMDASTSAPASKRHAACDACRTLKLKCSGELEGCNRCRRDGLQCVYSEQKQMGRPRKRRREEIENATPAQNRAAIEDLQSMDAPAGIASPWPAYTTLGLQGEFAGLLDMPFDVPIDLDQHVTRQSRECETASSTSPSETTREPQESTFAGQPVVIGAAPTPGIGDTLDDSMSCACLSNAYLALSNLQSTKNLPFPVPLPSIRSAMATVGEMLNCRQCLKEPVSATQTTMLVGTLLTSLTQQVHLMLKSIDAEAATTEVACTTKRFRMGDTSEALAPFHTGTPDCPAAFVVDLEPREWRTFAKKAVKSEVMGSGPGKRSLPDLINLMEERHDACASKPGMQSAHDRMCLHSELPKEQHLCIQIVRGLQGMARRFEWS